MGESEKVLGIDKHTCYSIVSLMTVEVPREKWRSVCMTVAASSSPLVPLGQEIIESYRVGRRDGGSRGTYLMSVYMYIDVLSAILN